MGEEKSVVIIGAGIIGIATAAILVENGYNVQIMDKRGIGEETSAGNAGAFAFSDVLPIASKGIMKKLPYWMVDPLGPFTIRPSYFPKLLPWFYQFWRASSQSAQFQTISAQVSLMDLARREMAALIERASLQEQLGTKGVLEVYESDKEFEDFLPSWNMRERYGIEIQHLNRAEFDKIQPGLSNQFTRATFVPSWRNVKDPKIFCKKLWAYAERLGAKYLCLNAKNIVLKDNLVIVQTKEGQTVTTRQVVLAAGAWSREFARSLGDKIPLDTERGYNTTLPRNSLDLRQQVTFCGHGFVIVPLETGIRVGGAVEMGGLSLPPDYRRCNIMLEKARNFFPELKTENGVQWMGFRPSIPDGLPVIDYSSESTKIIYAFGHGHLGLTQSAATARLVYDLLAKRESDISLTPFNARRF